MDHRLRQIGRIVQEGAQETYRAQLQGKAQPVGLASLLGNPLTVVVVQMEIAAKFVGGGRSRKAAVTLTLRSGEETDRHGRKGGRGFAKQLSFANGGRKGFLRVKAVSQKWLAKAKPFARLLAKPYPDEDRLRARFEL
jgi:hypothetical protein